MIDPTSPPGQEVADALVLLASLEDDLRGEFYSNADIHTVAEGQFIFVENDPVGAFGFVLSGSARVFKLGETGREITLYRVEPGESCVLAASCIMNRGAYPAYAVAETDLEVLLIPSEVFSGWVADHAFWRDYVFALVARHISSVMSVVEEVAFRRVDHRILEYLANAGSDEVQATHQEVAADLGTSREVVSRILKDLERRGLVGLSRARITILDRERIHESLPGGSTVT